MEFRRLFPLHSAREEEVRQQFFLGIARLRG
jgi:hypothetical protein